MGRNYQIVETDNFNGDYPNEKFLNLPFMLKPEAEAIAAVINDSLSSNIAPRWWKVVERGYELQPGLEP